MATKDGLAGQWLGSYEGTTTGQVILNIDEVATHYEGLACLSDSQSSNPGSIVEIKTENKNPELKFNVTHIFAYSPATWQVLNPDQLREEFPKLEQMSSSAEVPGKCDAKQLELSWETNIGVQCHCVLPRSKAGELSELPARTMHWGEFKNFALSLISERRFFRGQRKPWRLRTPFHRHRRADLVRFLNWDIPNLRFNLSSRTKHFFNLNDQEENGAFFQSAPAPRLSLTSFGLDIFALCGGFFRIPADLSGRTRYRETRRYG